MRQEGRKGNPAYTGRANGGVASRFWQWPYWDKDSVYFISSTQLGQDHTLKFRLYHDRYKNGLDMFTDNTYTRLSGPRSVYDDRTFGGAIELISRAIQGHEIHLAAHYKDDEHKADGEVYRDVTQSFAIEDMITLSSQWRLRLGASYEYRKAKEAFTWPTGSTSGGNGLAEVLYDITDDHQVFAGVAYKTRFPTIKDRFSGRMGRFLPNPELKRETSLNMEFGYRGSPWQGGRLEAVLFQSNLRNEIQEVLVPDPGMACPANRDGTCSQMQNTGRTRHRGVEISLEQQFGEQWRAGLAYTYLHRTSQSDPHLRMTNTPRHRLFAHVGWKPAPQWELLATLEAESGRFDNYGVGGEPYRQLSGYGILGLTTIWTPRKDVTLEVGVNNLGNRHYELADGYPMPGRVWFANASYRF